MVIHASFYSQTSLTSDVQKSHHREMLYSDGELHNLKKMNLVMWDVLTKWAKTQELWYIPYIIMNMPITQMATITIGMDMVSTIPSSCCFASIAASVKSNDSLTTLKLLQPYLFMERTLKTYLKLGLRSVIIQ